MSEQTFMLSNPRKSLTVDDWPLGGSRRGECVFSHQKNSRGERISKQTTGKPKFTRYYQAIRIVDGSDGKTHFLGDCGSHLSVMSADIKHSDFSVFSGDENYSEYLEMVRSE